MTRLLRLLTIASFLFINFFGIASTDAESSLFNQLKDVNAQWNFHSNHVPTFNIDFESDADLIQFHLEQVASVLRSESSVSWTDQQLNNRLQLLDVLESYAERKVFPTNLYHSTRTPYFIDDFGVHCAVGYLIEQSGNEVLAVEISQKFNYNYIEDIPSLEILVWAEKFGFTLDELKWIQPGYPPVEVVDQVGNGTNGNVKEVFADYFSDRLIFVGDFDSVDLQPCLHIGVYQNDQLSCLDNGLAGVVNDVYLGIDGVYVVGELESNGATYPFAFYDGASWHFPAIPGRDGAIGTSLNQFDQAGMEISLQHSFLNGSEEIWLYSMSSNLWELMATVNGVILDIESTNNGHFYVGHFDSVTPNAAVPYTIPVTNVVVAANSWYGLGSEICDTVKTVKQVGTSVIFGGTCSNDPAISDVCLSRYVNGTLQTLLQVQHLDPFASSISDIAYLSGTDLVVGGDFNFDPLLGVFGKSLVKLNMVSGAISGMAKLDGGVNSLVYRNNDLYIGGDFENQYTNQSLKHLARISWVIGIEEETIEINAYPNPFQSTIRIEGFDANSRYSVYDLSGKVLCNDELLSDGNLDLSDLENGVYMLQIQTGTGLVTERIVKAGGIN